MWANVCILLFGVFHVAAALEDVGERNEILKFSHMPDVTCQSCLLGPLPLIQLDLHS